MKKTITPADLIYKVKPRNSSVFSFQFGKAKVSTQGVYRIGTVFGGRIAMY